MQPKLRLRFPPTWHTARVCYKGLFYTADVNAVVRIEKGIDTLLVSGNIKLEQLDDYETPPNAFRLKIDGYFHGTNDPFTDKLTLPSGRDWSMRSAKKRSEHCQTRCVLLNVADPVDWRECQITIRLDDEQDVVLSKAFVLALEEVKQEQEFNRGADMEAERGLEPSLLSEQGSRRPTTGKSSTLGSLLDDIAPWIVLLVSIVVHVLAWPIKKSIWLAVSIMVIIVRIELEFERRVDGFLAFEPRNFGDDRQS